MNEDEMKKLKEFADKKLADEYCVCQGGRIVSRKADSWRILVLNNDGGLFEWFEPTRAVMPPNVGCTSSYDYKLQDIITKKQALKEKRKFGFVCFVCGILFSLGITLCVLG